MIMELHIIQNFAPANLNRDDTNTPKDCFFGGIRRARISSQCIKRSVRQHADFANAVKEAGGDLGIRTKLVIGEIADLLRKNHKRDIEDAQKVAERAVALFGVKRDKKKTDKTSILLYLGKNELDDLAVTSNKNWETLFATEVAVADEESDEESEEEGGKKEKKGKKPKSTKLTDGQKAVQKELQGTVSDERLKSGAYAADIALFGRMVADKNIKNMGVDAACQVAHAISTHKVEMEMDYFTAVDDLLPNEETGAGMIGTVEFNSSCFYRYSNVNFDMLKKNLGFNKDLSAAAVTGFVEASVKAVPTGKQNSMAAQNPPGFVRVVVRKDGAWSLTNAFQKPIRPSSDASVEELSIKVMNEYFDRLASVYGKDAIICDASFNVHQPDGNSLSSLLGALKACLKKEGDA